jgi:hypothetical protein
VSDDDTRAIRHALNECRTQRDHHLFYAREASRKIKQLEGMLEDMKPYLQDEVRRLQKEDEKR